MNNRRLLCRLYFLGRTYAEVKIVKEKDKEIIKADEGKKMLKMKRLRFWQNLLLVAMICLSSCTTANYNNCHYSVAGKKVAQELEKVSYAELPNIWERSGRIIKLR